MPPNNSDLSHDPTRTVARHTPDLSEAASTPHTFPSEAESLLRHLKLGAAPDETIPPSDAPSGGPDGTPAAGGPDSGAFPHIPGYEIECELGRGGMGVVYKARHAALRHTVAIKMILASASTAPAEVARFMAEAESVAQVKHPNVVQVFDLGVTAGPGPDAGRPYFVMEYAAGGNLAALLKERGSLDPDAAAALIETVARGVHAANDVGIVHRDLKPGNILLTSAEPKTEPKSGSLAPSVPRSAIRDPRSALVPKVSDFGLAKRLSSDMTRSQAVMGTPAYMAPEQAGGKAKFVGPQADVYALGVILYQCLTGAVPFEDPDPWALIRRVLEDAPEPPRKRAPRVPRDLELICLKCLEKEPHHRYPTAAELADDLRRFLNREAVSVRPIGVPTRLVRWAKKHPSRAALWVVGVALAVAVPAVSVGIQGRLDRESAVSAEARQTAVEAERAAAEARRAEEEAKRARVATEELARINELNAIRNKLGTRATARLLGWTSKNLADLPRAVSLVRDDPDVFRELRSAAAVALLSDALQPADPVAEGFTGAELATDPKTGRIAVGEYKGWGKAQVQVIEPGTGHVHKLTYKAVAVGTSQDGTRALAFSPDGRWLFVGTRSGRVLRFDLDAPEQKPLEQEVSKGEVDHLAVSPDGRTVYAVGAEPHVLALSADSLAALKPFAPPAGERVNAVAVLPSGDLIASTGARLHHWRADGTPVRSAAVPGARCLAAGPGSLLLVGARERLEVYDRHTLQPTDTFADPALRRATHEEGLRTIALHPSGAFAATGAGLADRRVKVWELSSGRLVGFVTVPGIGPISATWSADGSHLLVTATRQVSRWKFAPAPAQRFACASGPPLAAATFTRDGRIAALGEAIDGWRDVLVGNGVAPEESEQAHDPAGVEHPGLTAAPDGTIFVATGTGGFVWKPGTAPRGANLAKISVGSPRISPDGGTLWAVVGSRTVRTFDPATLAERHLWDNSISERLYGVSTIDALAVGRTGAAAGAREGAVYWLDRECRPTPFHGIDPKSLSLGDAVLSVAVASDDSFVVAGTVSGRLRLIRLADKTELPAVSAHPGGVSAVAISRDGSLLATGGRDQSVRLWKRTGDRLEPLLTVPALQGAVHRLYFSPSDGRLLVLLAHEHSVRVWDLDRLSARLAELKLGW